jgi:hypothetical protein
MEEHYSILIALQENLPDTYSDESVHLLEQLVTRYQEILDHISQTADPDNSTLFYREQMPVLENHLKNARYGHTEKQRMTGFNKANIFMKEAITALLFQLNEQVKLSHSKDSIN